MQISGVALATALLITASLPAVGQTNPPPPPATNQRAIVNGKDIQPRLPPTQQPTDAPSPLLKEHKDDGPVVEPKDIYGNPLDTAEDPPPGGKGR